MRIGAAFVPAAGYGRHREPAVLLSQVLVETSVSSLASYSLLPPAVPVYLRLPCLLSDPAPNKQRRFFRAPHKDFALKLELRLS